MDSSEYIKVAQFEHRFWLQILGDHARFIFYSLAANEDKLVKNASHYINAFDNLLNKARKSLTLQELNEITEQSLKYTQKLRKYKLSILEQLLVGKIKMNMTPTFINHMLNELEEYLLILNQLIENQIPEPENPVHYHLVWLLDAVGHANAINTSLDTVENHLITKSKSYLKQFKRSHLKALEMKAYMRTGRTEFPAFGHFNDQVNVEMNEFIKYLNELETLLMEKKALGPFSPLMADHMIREECYYLIKIALTTNSELPICDPTKSRLTF